ncbi:MAG: nidogen-like domain-containing protein [Bacteroidota bacterium]
MKTGFTRIFIIGICLIGLGRGWAQGPCPGQTLDTLYWSNFETEVGSSWKLNPTPHGGEWNQDTGQFGTFGNPGEDKWLYINDEAENNACTAIAEMPVIAPSSEKRVIELRADINFQAFADSGKMSLEMWWNEEWQPLYQTEEDVLGELHLTLEWPAAESLKLRWVYDDGGAWGWGFGLDNLVLTAPNTSCGNGRCEAGESPESCPGDCPNMLEEPDVNYVWIEPGTDIDGVPVAYQDFKGGTKCDDCSEQITLPFSWNLYGITYDHLWANSNGNLTFDEPFSVFTPAPFCLEGIAMLAPFFSDVDLSKTGELSYYIDPAGHYVIFTWLDVVWFGSEAPFDRTNSFQLILTDGTLRQIGSAILPLHTNLIYSYDEMNWTTGNSSGGQNGWGGVPATVGINLGDGNVCKDMGTFGYLDWRYLGNRQDDGCGPNGVQYLAGRSFFWQGETGSPLDVQGVSDFAVEQDADQVYLQWHSDQPFRYRVLRGLDSLNLDLLTELFPGDGPGGLFAWADTSPLPGEYLYVLQALGEEQEQWRSARIYVEGAPPLDTTLRGSWKVLGIGPNPMQDQLTARFKAPRGSSISYLLVDMAGREHRRGQLKAPMGEGEIILQTGDLPAAMYVMTLFYGGRPYHRNLVKLR